jgi:hypothetical protein
VSETDYPGMIEKIFNFVGAAHLFSPYILLSSFLILVAEKVILVKSIKFKILTTVA